MLDFLGVKTIIIGSSVEGISQKIVFKQKMLDFLENCCIIKGKICVAILYNNITRVLKFVKEA